MNPFHVGHDYSRITYHLTILPVLCLVRLLFQRQAELLFDMLIVSPVSWWSSLLDRPYLSWIYPTLFVIGAVYWIGALTVTWTPRPVVNINVADRPHRARAR